MYTVKAHSTCLTRALTYRSVKVLYCFTPQRVMRRLVSLYTYCTVYNRDDKKVYFDFDKVSLLRSDYMRTAEVKPVNMHLKNAKIKINK